MDHAVDFARQAYEQPELGNVLDLAFHLGVDRVLLQERIPRIVHGLLETQADPPLLRIGIEDHHLDFLTGGHDLSRMNVFLRPAHFRDMDQAFDAWLQLDERAVVGNVGHAAGETDIYRILGFHTFPRICFKLLHTEADTLGLAVEADNLYVDGLSDLQGF